MNRDSVPRLKRATLSDKITLSIEPELKRELWALKESADVDVMEWIRSLIRREFPNLKKFVA